MSIIETTTTGKKLTEALDYLKSAIELLDAGSAPGHIAAHADLAAAQLQEFLVTTERNAWGAN